MNKTGIELEQDLETEIEREYVSVRKKWSRRKRSRERQSLCV